MRGAKHHESGTVLTVIKKRYKQTNIGLTLNSLVTYRTR